MSGIAKSDWWSDSHQQTQIRFGAQTMGFGDFTDGDVAGFSRYGGVVLSQKFTFALKNYQAQLALDFMAVEGKFLAGIEDEIYNFKIR